MRIAIINTLMRVVIWLVNSPTVARLVYTRLPKSFKYDIYGECLREFITRTEIDTYGELDLLLESLYTIKYGYCDNIRVCAAYLDKDFGTTALSHKVIDVCGPATNCFHNPMD